MSSRDPGWMMLVCGLVFGIVGLVFVGLPLWLNTGVLNYLRLSFFGGLVIGVFLGRLLESNNEGV